MSLKEIREARGISQYKLSHTAGVRQSTICRIESGEQKPGADIIIKLCDALDCTADELLGRKAAT